MNLFGFLKRTLKPFDCGYLPEKDGHSIYYHQYGNPNGNVVLYFHGGPGGESKEKQARYFNLKKNRVVLFDQRACGKSVAADAFFNNCTPETIKDAKRLLDFLHINGKITVAGASFGSTCAVLFAETYPTLVNKIIAISVFLGRKKDFADFSKSFPLFYPDIMDTLNQQTLGADIDQYFHCLAFSQNRKQQEKAVKYYGGLEYQLGRKEMHFGTVDFNEKELFSLRCMLHYCVNNMFLTENQILKNCDKIKNIETLIYQNRLDFCCPPYQAYELHKALPKSKLILFPSFGHGSKALREKITQDLKEM